MNRYQGVRYAAQESLISRREQFDMLTPEAFIAWLVMSGWTREAALAERERIARLASKGKSGIFQIY